MFQNDRGLLNRSLTVFHEEKFKKINQEMWESIQKTFSKNTNITEDLIQLWEKECKDQEGKSENIWNSKEEWLWKKAFHHSQYDLEKRATNLHKQTKLLETRQRSTENSIGQQKEGTLESLSRH